MLRAIGVVGSLAAGVLFANRRLRNWGASTAEVHATFSGDELITAPASQNTLAVTVNAPASEVWKWLVQIGADRGGMYSYDRLENVIGLHIHTTRDIREEWQHLSVGDRVTLVRRGWPLMPRGYSLPVAIINEGQSIVLRQQPPEHPWDSIWSFHVYDIDETHCRLLSRTKTRKPSGIAQRLATVAAPVGDTITFAMTRRMLLGIKERAEGRAFTRAKVR